MRSHSAPSTFTASHHCVCCPLKMAFEGVLVLFVQMASRAWTRQVSLAIGNSWSFHANRADAEPAQKWNRGERDGARAHANAGQKDAIAFDWAPRFALQPDSKPESAARHCDKVTCFFTSPH